MKKFGTVILGLLMVVGAIFIREMVAAIGMFVYGFYKIAGGTISKEELTVFIQSLGTNSTFILSISALGTVVWIIVFGILYKKTRKSEGKRLFEGKITVVRIVMLFMMGLGLQFLMNSILTSLLRVAPNLMDNYKQVVETLGMGNSLISFVFIVLIAPIGEELVFRGMTMTYLKKHLSFIAANTFQALFFGLYHMNVIQAIYAFFLGLILGWVAEKYGSIRESILLHMAVNLSGCLVSYIMPESLVENWSGIGLLFVLSVCLLVLSVRTVKMEEVSENLNMVE